MGSCKSGYPETSGNLANTLMLHTTVGALAGTRNSYYRDNRTTFGDNCYIPDVLWYITWSLVAGYSSGTD